VDSLPISSAKFIYGFGSALAYEPRRLITIFHTAMGNSENNDVFSKWVLGVTASVVIALGSGLFITMMNLREDMAVVKSTIARIERTEAAGVTLEKKVLEIEYRVRKLEYLQPQGSAQR